MPVVTMRYQLVFCTVNLTRKERMILKILFLAIMATDTRGEYTPSSDAYALSALIPIINPAGEFIFDGPGSISHAQTIPTTTYKPTVETMMYYNYYAASTYFAYQLDDLSCPYCHYFKNDVYDHTVLRNDNQNTLALIALSKTRKEIVVTFRGTQNIWSAILDLEFVNVDYPGKSSNVKLHRGFFTAAMSLYEEVVKNVGYLRELFPDYKIVIAGHSLGAAIARVTQYFLVILNQFPEAIYEVYTFGEPRVGNKDLADFVNNLTIVTARVVARADLVPHIPPTSVATTDILTDYYIHPQTEFWINGQMNQTFCNTSVYEDPNCSDSMGPAYTVVDHLYYFDVDLMLSGSQPVEFLAIPADILEPSTDFPPLPTTFSDFTAAFSNFVLLLAPLIGK